MSTLIIAEHDNRELKPITANLVGAATELNGDIHIAVLGSNCQAVAEQAAKLNGVTSVRLWDAPTLEHQLSEDCADQLIPTARDYQYILAPATTGGKNLLPRLAALIDCQPISDIIEIVDGQTFKHPIYAGNCIETVQTQDSTICLTVRGTAFNAVEHGNSATIDSQPIQASSGLSEFVSQALANSERPELTAAKIVVSGGRGLGSADNFELIYQLADKLGAAVGASRAAVDAGFVANDLQVGQTGKIVAPELYIAIGISGAIQHLAGMKDSGVIVAINKDEDAPIFSVADYGLVADLFEAVPELQQALG